MSSTDETETTLTDQIVGFFTSPLGLLLLAVAAAAGVWWLTQ